MERLIDFYSKQWNDHAILIYYKKSKIRIKVAELSEVQQQQLKDHDSSNYQLVGQAYVIGRNIDPKTMTFTFNNYGIPVKLKEHVIKPTKYIKYRYWKNDMFKYINIQQNGFLVYCAPTGQGKTYFALNNLELLASQVDTVLYINFELSIDDIKNRCESMDLNIPDNLYIAPLDHVKVIEEWAEDKGTCLFIIDNIDNLVGGGLDPFGEQLNFIKDLDRFLKDYNHHALVLTQLVKENNMNLLAKDGEINDGITTNILSGVKQLSYLSRSVMMTSYSPELNKYVYKMLKVGSAKE